MKRFIALFIVIAFASSAVSCKQIDGLFGKKDDEQKKMQDIAAKAAEMLADQQKKAAEEKAKLDLQVETEVQKRLADEKAKADAAQALAQAQTQPTAQPPVPEKVVEKIIIRETSPNTPKGNVTEAKPKGYLRIYVDKGLGGGSMSIPFGRNISTTNGTAFKDNCSSASYNVPAGWQVAIYAGSGYSEKRITLSGSGTANDLGQVNDKCSSFRWERQ